MKRCVVLRQEVAEDAEPDEQDTLAAANVVGAALRARGWDVECLALGLDLRGLAARLRADPPELVFNLVESLPGARFSGPASLAAAALLEASAVPFTGSRLAALAISTDKPTAKRTLRRAGIPVAPDLEDGAPGPFIVKHASEHASFGLSLCSFHARAPEEIPPGCFVETFLAGREFNVSLLEGPDGLEVLPLAELVFTADWPADCPRILDYSGKWRPDDPRFRATERRFEGIEPGLAADLRRLGRRAFAALGLAGYGRVDIRLDGKSVAYVLEVNANPALAPDAGFAAATAEAGISYEETIARIAAAALGEGARVRATRTAPDGPAAIAPVLAFRSDVDEPDRAAIDRLVTESGFFTTEERAVALELVDAARADGDASGYRFLLAAPRDSGDLLGYACFGPVPATASSWDLYWIVVAASARGQGIGRALLEEVARCASAAGGERLIAETSGRALYAPTREFYRAMGFTLHAILPDFYAPGDAQQIWICPLPLR